MNTDIKATEPKVFIENDAVENQKRIKDLEKVLANIFEKNNLPANYSSFNTVSEVFVDKEDIAALLKFNYAENRKLNMPAVYRLVDVINSGFWIVGESMFVYTDCANGINGNTRLNAMHRSNQDKFKIVIRTNASLDEFIHMDSGRKRSDVDASGYCQEHVAVGNFILKTANRANSHRMDKIKMFKAIEDVYSFAQVCKQKEGYNKSKVSPGALAALVCHSMKAKTDEELNHTYSQWENLVTRNFNIDKEDPVATASKDLKGEARKSYEDNMVTCSVVWFALSQDSKTKVRRPFASDKYPPIIRKECAALCDEVLGTKN